MIRSICFSIAVVFILHLIHWTSVLLYSNYCVAYGWRGYWSSYLTAASPVCKILMEIQYQSIRIFDVILISFSVFLTHKMEIFAGSNLRHKSTM